MTSPAWATAEELVTNLGRAVAGLPDPVVAAVRAELADHLEGCDGVLVPACASTVSGRRSALFLVVSGPLHWLGDRFWEDLLGEHGELSVIDDDALFPLGGPVVVSTEWWELVSALHHVEPDADAPFGLTMAQLRQADEDDEVDLTIRVDHLVAFVEHHHPQLLERLQAKLSR